MAFGYLKFKWVSLLVFSTITLFTNSSYAISCTNSATEKEKQLAEIALGVKLSEGNREKPCISGHYLHDYRHVKASSLDYHAGVDIAVSEGTKAYSIMSGVVRHASESRGQLIITSDVYIDGKKVEAVYLHLSKISVKKGDLVFVGQSIGQTGSRGFSFKNEVWQNGAVGPHLHIEVRPEGSKSTSGLYDESKLCLNNRCNTSPASPKNVENATIDPVRVFDQAHGCGGFYDVSPNHRYCESIQYAIENNIISGYSNGSFGANKLVNRAEFVKMVSLANNIAFEGEGIKEHSFDDLIDANVPLNEWYIEYIYAARKKGFINGYGGSNKFYPEKSINYVEALKIALEASGVLVAQDTIKGEHWYSLYVNFALANEFDSLKPNDMINRSFAVYLLCKIANKDTCNE